MRDLQILGIGALAVLIFMTLAWIGSLIRKDASIVDTFWEWGLCCRKEY